MLVFALVIGQQSIFGFGRGPGNGELINVAANTTTGTTKTEDLPLQSSAGASSEDSSGVVWHTTKPGTSTPSDKYGNSAETTAGVPAETAARAMQAATAQNGAAERTTASATAGVTGNAAGNTAGAASNAGASTQASASGTNSSAAQNSSNASTTRTTGSATTQTTRTDAGTGSSPTTVETTVKMTTTTVTTTETTLTKLNPQVLKDKIICIDPGHQRKQNSELEQIAPDSSVKKPKVSSGTAGINTGDAEYALNLAVALKLKSLLEAGGATVVMTRTDHDVDISNIERAKIGNDANSDLVVRIHADGSTNRDTKGVTILIPSSKYVGEAIAETSKKAGQAVLDAVIAATGAKSRGLSVRDDMTGFNWSTVPVVLIEMGFMSNPEEDRLLATDEYRAKMATGLYNGCIAYFSQ